MRLFIVVALLNLIGATSEIDSSKHLRIVIDSNQPDATTAGSFWDMKSFVSKSVDIIISPDEVLKTTNFKLKEISYL